jgi:uncharacterized NAD(P)/FAD-binding protein YdhS
MCSSNYIPPDRMTPEQRRDEVASLLAAGLARLRCEKFVPVEEIAEKRPISLGFSGYQSVHTDPANMEIKES